MGLLTLILILSGTHMPPTALFLMGGLSVLGFGGFYFMTIHVERRRDKKRTQAGRQLIKEHYTGKCIVLEAVDALHKGFCVLELKTDTAVLRRHDDLEFEIPRDQAEYALLLPGFAQNRSNLVIHVGVAEYHFRNPGRAPLRFIRDWRDSALALTNPHLCQKIRKTGIRNLIIGILLIIAGPVLSYISYLFAADDEEGVYYILYGVSLVGLVYLVLGIGQLKRHARITHILATNPKPRPTPPPLPR